jgi:hypothetical protein
MSNFTSLIENAIVISDNGVDVVLQVAVGTIAIIHPIVDSLRRSGVHSWQSKGDSTTRDYLSGKAVGVALVKIPSMSVESL